MHPLLQRSDSVSGVHASADHLREFGIVAADVLGSETPACISSCSPANVLDTNLPPPSRSVVDLIRTRVRAEAIGLHINAEKSGEALMPRWSSNCTVMLRVRAVSILPSAMPRDNHNCGLRSHPGGVCTVDDTESAAPHSSQLGFESDMGLRNMAAPLGAGAAKGMRLDRAKKTKMMPLQDGLDIAATNVENDNVQVYFDSLTVWWLLAMFSNQTRWGSILSMYQRVNLDYLA